MPLGAPSSLTIGLDSRTIDQLIAFRNLLIRWNDRFNLTAIVEPVAIDRRLIGDALRMLPAIDAATAKLENEPRLIDIGTGAGLPGLVFKIARPRIQVTLVDATGKKISFLREVIKELRLDGVSAIHARAEEIGHDTDHRGTYDIATARAVAALPVLLELCIPLLRPRGCAFFPKGADITDELAAAEIAARTLGAAIRSSDLLGELEGLPVTRLVRAVKIETTPGRYPRRPGVPAREPLGRSGQ